MEDTELDRELLVQIFEGSYDIRLAADGVTACELASSEPPDLILMDIGLPGLSGLDAVRAIRATGSTVPIIAVSSRVMPGDRSGRSPPAATTSWPSRSTTSCWSTWSAASSPGDDRQIRSACRRPARILIVDDEPLNVDYLEQELEGRGFEIETAANGLEALERSRPRRPTSFCST